MCRESQLQINNDPDRVLVIRERLQLTCVNSLIVLRNHEFREPWENEFPNQRCPTFEAVKVETKTSANYRLQNTRERDLRQHLTCHPAVAAIGCHATPLTRALSLCALRSLFTGTHRAQLVIEILDSRMRTLRRESRLFCAAASTKPINKMKDRLS